MALEVGWFAAYAVYVCIMIPSLGAGWKLGR